MSNDLMQQIHTRLRSPDKATLPQFDIGDQVEVRVKITEGDKTRTQAFTGTVIAKRHGGLDETFTVRRIVDGEGVERTFPAHSPHVAGVKVVRHGVVRRAKLFYLRDRVGKATRLRERVEAEAEVPVDGGAAADAKKKGRKRGAKAKAERKARVAAEIAAGGGKKKKKKKKGEGAEAEKGAETAKA